MTTNASSAELNPRLELERAVLLAYSPLLILVILVLLLLPRAEAGAVFAQVFVILVATLGAMDLISMKVPNLLTYPAIGFGFLGTAVIDRSQLDEAALGFAALLAVMFIFALVGRGALGMGDVKFAALVGCFMGWQIGALAVFSGIALAWVVAVAIVILSLREKTGSIPLSPFLASGVVLWVIIEGTLVN